MSVCGSCGAAVRWGLTTIGARMPLDPEPSQDGTVWVRPDGRFRVLEVEERRRAREAGEPVYASHFATCPAAQRHRGVSRQQLGLGV